MMRRLWITATTLALAALACTVGPTTTPAPHGPPLATQVAATLTALAPAAVETTAAPQAPAEDTPPATEVPAGPDELLIVYVDDGNPFITTIGGPPTQLSTAGSTVDVLISDDGQRVVFMRRESTPGESPPVEIRAVNSDGSGEQTLVTAEQFDALYPLDDMLHNDLATIAFIPGSHDLLLNTRAIAEGPGLLKYNDLLRLDSDSGELTEILPPGDGGDFVIAPDGTQLALIRPDTVSLVNTDGSNLRPDLINYEPVITYSEYQYYAQPIWAADSSELALLIPSADPLAETTSATLWRLPVAGAAEEVTTFNGNFFFHQQNGNALIAPDFSRVVVPREDGATDLGLAPFAGGDVTVYDSGDIGWVNWAPDSSRFVYSKGGPMQLQLGQVAGDPSPLVTGDELRWTGPDSYLYLSGSMGNWTLFAGTLGEAPIELAAPAGDFIPYDFSP